MLRKVKLPYYVILPNAEGVGLRALNFVRDSALILASLFKNFCVKTPKGLTLLSVLTSDFLNAEGVTSRRFGQYKWSA